MDTYTVKCHCSNCGNSFIQKVEKGKFIVEGAGNSRYGGSPITAISSSNDGYMWDKTVECPNCGTDNIIVERH